jgi:hypothetical protein
MLNKSSKILRQIIIEFVTYTFSVKGGFDNVFVSNRNGNRGRHGDVDEA